VPRFLGALDQGTTSTRFVVFDEAGSVVGHQQLEHRQIFPQAGWVEHDPMEILERARTVMLGGVRDAGVTARDLSAIGITNQRETTVVWNPRTGEPWHNALVWQDTRTAAAVATLAPWHEFLQRTTGLPPATYFSATKLAWILGHVSGVREAALRGEAVAGTVDSWLVWNLTGGKDGGRHVTDVSNASRTQLMNLATLRWDDEMLTLFDIPRAMLPDIHHSCDAAAFGETRPGAPFTDPVVVGGVLGDQHAALLGQACLGDGDTKNTYGTGNFLLMLTGPRRVASTAGLLSTIGHALPGRPPSYALEGSVAVTGSAVQWLRDQLGIIRAASEVEALAASVPDTGGAYFVPAFSGLFAPYWRPDARGAIVGLSRFHSRAHLARATLEAIAFQTRDVLDAMTADSGIRVPVLKVDGGATVNNLLMQLQADVLGVPVVRPQVAETTALGAAYAAGLAVGVWKDADSLRAQWKVDRQWEPQWSADQREQGYQGWRKAVSRSLDWA
jgi:glycerol kinase